MNSVASWDTQTLEDVLAERGVCGAKLRGADGWRAHPEGASARSDRLRCGTDARYGYRTRRSQKRDLRLERKLTAILCADVTATAALWETTKRRLSALSPRTAKSSTD